jgi:hypothetical protein
VYAVTVLSVSAPYHPGQQPQWRPEPPPPIQFRQEEPPPPAPKKGLQWTLRIAGLVAVAVISGLVWNYVTDDTTSTPTDTAGEETPTQSTGVYDLKPHKGTPKPDVDTNCAKHAYDDIQRFLQDNPCTRLTRQLFVTEVDGGRTVYASVSVVTMASEDKAAELRGLTDKNGTGNVTDVVKDGLVKIDGLTSLAGGGGYESTQKGRDVTIVEADFDPKDKGDEAADEKILDDVCKDALRKGPEIDAEAGSS